MLLAGLGMPSLIARRRNLVRAHAVGDLTGLARQLTSWAGRAQSLHRRVASKQNYWDAFMLGRLTVLCGATGACSPLVRISCL